jgi:hypothetical protein
VRVAKDGIFGEGCVGSRREVIALGDVVNIVDGVAPTGFEVGNDECGIKGPEDLGDDVCFEWEMASERGVTAGDKERWRSDRL